MEEILNQYLTQILEWLQTSAGFMQKEIPVFVEELIRYKTAYIATSFFISLFITFISCFIIVKYGSIAFRYNATEDEEKYTPVVIISLFALIMFSILSIAFFNPFFKIIFAPRVYLIEYLRTLL